MSVITIVAVISLIANSVCGASARSQTIITLSTTHSPGSPPTQNAQISSSTQTSGSGAYASSRGRFRHYKPTCTIMADTHTVTLIRQNCDDEVLSDAMASAIALGFVPLEVVTNTVTQTARCDGAALAEGFANYTC